MNKQHLNIIRNALEALENVRKYDKGNLYGLDDEIIALRQLLRQAVIADDLVAYKITSKFGSIYSFIGGPDIRKGDSVYICPLKQTQIE